MIRPRGAKNQGRTDDVSKLVKFNASENGKLGRWSKELIPQEDDSGSTTGLVHVAAMITADRRQLARGREGKRETIQRSGDSFRAQCENSSGPVARRFGGRLRKSEKLQRLSAMRLIEVQDGINRYRERVAPVSDGPTRYPLPRALEEHARGAGAVAAAGSSTNIASRFRSFLFSKCRSEVAVKKSQQQRRCSAGVYVHLRLALLPESPGTSTKLPYNCDSNSHRVVFLATPHTSGSIGGFIGKATKHVAGVGPLAHWPTRLGPSGEFSRRRGDKYADRTRCPLIRARGDSWRLRCPSPAAPIKALAALVDYVLLSARVCALGACAAVRLHLMLLYLARPYAVSTRARAPLLVLFSCCTSRGYPPPYLPLAAVPPTAVCVHLARMYAACTSHGSPTGRACAVRARRAASAAVRPAAVGEPVPRAPAPHAAILARTPLATLSI
ncbi:hypothetical protein FB451DRAFT_1188515 [Mycena latifolia]|nr:hypothetical protein FB451DRAFT_1188515 [Mycena latifolia]